jgi:hypothetical protein
MYDYIVKCISLHRIEGEVAMSKICDATVLRRQFLIGTAVGLAGVLLMVADGGSARAGGGGGGEGGNPRDVPLTAEARTKLKKLRDLMKKLEDNIKRGKARPLSDAEKRYYMGLLDIWAKYKESPEFQDALWAVYDAINATGPR